MQQCVTIVIGFTGNGTLIFDSQKGDPTKIALPQTSLDMALCARTRARARARTHTHTHTHTHTREREREREREGVQMEIFLYIFINVYFTLQQTIDY